MARATPERLKVAPAPPRAPLPDIKTAVPGPRSRAIAKRAMMLTRTPH